MKINKVLLITLILFPFAWAGDSQKLADELNGMYFNLNKAGVAQFSCKARSNMLEQMGPMLASTFGEDHPILAELQSMEYLVTWKKGDEAATVLVSELTKTGDAKQDAGLEQMASGAAQTLEGFLTTWLGMVGEPLIDSGEEISLTKTEQGYTGKTRDKDTKADIMLRFDKKKIVREMVMTQGGKPLILRPNFTATPKGLIPSDFKLGIGSEMAFEVTIHYENTEGFSVPGEVQFNMDMGQARLDIGMQFYDFKFVME